MNTVSENVADFGSYLQYEDLPQSVTSWAKGLILNTIAVGMGGYQTDIAEMARRTVLKTDHGEAVVWGSNTLVPPREAAFVNGVASHALDFDDTHPEAGIHACGVIVPAVLAKAQEIGASGKDVIVAVVVGLELMSRLGSAAPHKFTLAGFHASSVCGTVAGSAAVSRVCLGESAEMSSAIGISASMASGITQTVYENSNLKPIHLGWAAKASLSAYDLAVAGVGAPRYVLEGLHGLFRSFVPDCQVDLSRIDSELGIKWEMENIVPKVYPCCHFTHALIDCALEIRASLRLDDLSEIILRVPREAVNVVCEPWRERLRPTDGYAARFSLPYCVAVALQYGSIDVERFFYYEGVPSELQAIMAIMRYEVDDDPSLAQSYGAELIVRDLAGETYGLRRSMAPAFVDLSKDSSRFVYKVRELIRSRVGEHDAARIVEELFELEGCKTVSEIGRFDAT